MKTLSRQDLLDELEWRTRNFENGIVHLFSTMEWVRKEMERSIEYGTPRKYSHDMAGTKSAGSLAGTLVSVISQGYSNMDFRKLVSDAAALDAVEHMIATLDRTREMLPDETAALEAELRIDYEKRRAARLAEEAKRNQARAERCVGRHAHGNCSRRGDRLGPDGKRYCFQHAPEGSVK